MFCMRRRNEVRIWWFRVQQHVYTRTKRSAWLDKLIWWRQTQVFHYLPVIELVNNGIWRDGHFETIAARTSAFGKRINSYKHDSWNTTVRQRPSDRSNQLVCASARNVNDRTDRRTGQYCGSGGGGGERNINRKQHFKKYVRGKKLSRQKKKKEDRSTADGVIN